MIFGKDYMRAESAGYLYHFYIHDEIGSSEDYVDLLDTLYTASESDSIILHLNTPGGYLNTAVEILHAMASTRATVITSADGLVASAGSLLFFAGHSFMLGEFCEIMLHDGSGGAMGKINENLKSAQFTSKRLSNIYHKIYGRFFSEEQVDRVLNGEDLYLGSEDVENLINAYLEKLGEEDDTSDE